MGGIKGKGGMGGCRPSGRSSYGLGFSSFSTEEAFHAYNFPSPIPEMVPSFVFNRGVPPPTGGHPHVPGVSHCSCSCSTAFFALWQSLHLFCFGTHFVWMVSWGWSGSSCVGPHFVWMVSFGGSGSSCCCPFPVASFSQLLLFRYVYCCS